VRSPSVGSPGVRALLFDLDGTLVDTAQDLTIAANAVRRAQGLSSLSVDRVAACVGKGAEVLVRRVLADEPGGSLALDAPLPALSPERLTAAMQDFASAYARCNGEAARVYPGVVRGLERLRAAGMSMAVVTNKPQGFSEVLLERMGLAGYFFFVQGGDVLAHRKPRPEPLWHALERLGALPGQACMLGDSRNDAQAARAAGVRIFLVPYGYNEGLDPRCEDCDGVVDDVDAFASLILAQPGATDEACGSDPAQESRSD